MLFTVCLVRIVWCAWYASFVWKLGMTWYDTMLYDMKWNDIIWHDMVWCGMYGMYGMYDVYAMYIKAYRRILYGYVCIYIYIYYIYIYYILYIIYILYIYTQDSQAPPSPRGLDCSVLCDGSACEEIEHSMKHACTSFMFINALNTWMKIHVYVYTYIHTYVT